MFVGRQRELEKLGEMYESGRFECAIIYGRRRVGKTTLINEFVKDKKVIYFTGIESSAGVNLENLSRCIMEAQFGPKMDAVFTDFQTALDYLHEISADERIIMVIDEFPYLAASYRAISSLLQVQIDTKYKSGKLMLILCGSSMSFMENQVLGYKSPLYGRRTAQFKILPFNFSETLAYFRRFDKYDTALMYGVTGGVPQYLEFIDDSLSAETNIKRCFLDPNAFLYEEPTNLLKQEVRDPAYYNAIIRAIAKGASRNSEIASKTDMETGACANYLKNLTDLGIVRRETPMTERSARKAVYRISDGMFRFWYRFVPDNTALIARGMTDVLWKRIAPQLPGFMGGVFEDICKQWLWEENAAGRLPVLFTDAGRWWGGDPIKKQETEIDILAVSDDEPALFAECKWTGEKVDADTAETLVYRGGLFNCTRRHFYIFSKAGFTQRCVRYAAARGVNLISFDSMFAQSTA